MRNFVLLSLFVGCGSSKTPGSSDSATAVVSDTDTDSVDDTGTDTGGPPLDSDGDGISDADEIRQGTNPWVVDSRPAGDGVSGCSALSAREQRPTLFFACILGVLFGRKRSKKSCA